MIAPRLEARPFLLLVPVLVAAAWAFLPGLAGEFIWDDGTLIQHNARVQSADALPSLLTEPFWRLSSSQESANPLYDRLYRPVVSVAYLAQYLAFDGSPRGFHGVSLLLHLGCVALVFRWLRRRIGGTGIAPIVGAAIGAALFALHPTRPESVSWISGSTDLWMTLFLLLGLVAWERRAHTAGLLATWVAFSLALLSKEAAVVVPGLLLTDAFLLGDRSFPRRRFALLIGGFAAVVAFRLWLVPVWGGDAPRSLASPLEATQRVLSSLGLYLKQTLWPFAPSAQVGVRHAQADGSILYDTAWVALGIAGVAALLALGLLAWRRPQSRRWLADSLWFFAPLLPVLNFRDLGSKVLIGERFLYLPLLGLACILGRVCVGALTSGGRVGTGGVVALGLLLVVLTGVTRNHVAHFQSNTTLWSHQHAVDPDNLEAITALARLSHEARQPEQALALLRDGFARATSRGDAESALGFALEALNEMMSFTAGADQQTLNALLEAYQGVEDERRLFFEQGDLALRLPLDESQTRAALEDVARYRIPRAIALLRTLRLEQAQAELEQIVADRNAPSAWSLLIAIHARRLEWTAAEDALRRAQAAVPGHPAVAQMERLLARARSMLDRPVADAVEQAIRDADIQASLGGPEAARRLLAPHLAAEGPRPELVMAQVRAEMSDQQFSRAIAVVERARERTPDAVPWDPILGQLRAARAQAGFESRIWSAGEAKLP